MKILTIKSVMTPFPWSVSREASVADADAMMRDHGIHHLPVKDGDRLVGVVSAADLRRAGDLAPVVEAVMQADPYVVPLGTALEEVLFHMADHHIECVLVTKKGRLAGIFTHVDACRAFGRELRSQRPDGDEVA